MADARSVANRFIQLAGVEGKQLTPMQVLKLVYIAHGWMLGLGSRPLISQPVEAWQYGPVVRDVYNAFRPYGGGKIPSPLPYITSELADDENKLVQDVYGIYGHMTGIALSNITHMPNTPWHQTYKPGQFGIPISNDLIAAHYRRLGQERGAGA